MSPSAFRCLASALVLLAVSAGPLSAAIKIAGSVEAGEQRIAGAQVTLLPAADPAEGFEALFADPKLVPLAGARSERDGSFELLAPEAGFYRVVVEAEGYLGTLRWAVALTPSLVSLGPIELVPARRVRLAVSDPEGRPVAGARIRIRFKDQGLVRAPRWPLFYRTAADGGAMVAVPAAEEALGVVAVPGFALNVAKLAMGAEAAALRLEAGTPLTIKAVDTRRRPLPDVGLMVGVLGTAIGRSGRDGQVSVPLLPGQEKLELLDAAGRRAALEVPPQPAAGPLEVELAEPRLIAGQVVEAPGQAPIEGAWVFVGTWPPLFTRSDRAGHFELALPPAGEFEVQAVKEGYLRARAPAAGPAPLILGLEPAARIEGRVKSGGRGVAGARVSVTSDMSFSPRRFTHTEAETDKEGRFVLDEVAAGDPLEVDVMIGMRRLPRTRVPPLAAGESRVVDFELPHSESWACRVVDPAGNPVPGAEVVAMKVASGMSRLTFANREVWDRTFNLVRVGKTDPQGRLAAELPEAGIFDFGVLAKGFGPKLLRGVRVGRDPDDPAEPSEPWLPEEIVLNPAVPVRGQVTGGDGQGIVEVGIFMTLASDDPRGGIYRGGARGTPTATTEASGEFSFREVEAGQRFFLLAHKEGYLPAVLEDAAADGEPLRLVLHRAARLEGKVMSGGRPVSRAWLELEQLEPLRRPGDWGGRNLRGISDAEGKYSIDGLGPGRYRILGHGPDGYRKFVGESFEIASGEKKVLDIEREKGVVVFGKVLLPTGEPVPAAQVSHGTAAEDEGMTFGGEGSTDALGQYRLATAAAGPGWLRVERPGHKPLRRPVDLDEEVNEVDLVLEAGSIELEGRVVAPGGEPVTGATVTLTGEEIHREIASGPDGAVLLSGLESGEYLLQIRQEGYLFKPQQLELKTSRRGLEWQLAGAGSRLRGQIAGVAERELPDLEIAARLLDPEVFKKAEGAAYPIGLAIPGQIGAGGRFEVGGLGPGRWSLVAVNPRAGAVAEATVEIADGQSELEQDLDFGRLAGPWVAHIRQGGKNLARFHYALVSANGGGLLFAPSLTGRLELRAPPGSYRLSIHTGIGRPQEIEIEIGAPSEQVIELPPP
jgi:hypothetical protein